MYICNVHLWISVRNRYSLSEFHFLYRFIRENMLYVRLTTEVFLFYQINSQKHIAILAIKSKLIKIIQFSIDSNEYFVMLKMDPDIYISIAITKSFHCSNIICTMRYIFSVTQITSYIFFYSKTYLIFIPVSFFSTVILKAGEGFQTKICIYLKLYEHWRIMCWDNNRV